MHKLRTYVYYTLCLLAIWFLSAVYAALTLPKTVTGEASEAPVPTHSVDGNVCTPTGIAVLPKDCVAE